MKISIEERLNDIIEERDNEIEKLEHKLQELEDEKTERQWEWRKLRTLTKEENLNLPVPRLEIRIEDSADGYQEKCMYGLVYEHLLGHFIHVPLGCTTVGGGSNHKYASKLESPFRDGAHIVYDMYTLNLPGFIVGDGKYREIDIEDTSCHPNKLSERIKRDENSKKSSRPSRQA